MALICSPLTYLSLDCPARGQQTTAGSAEGQPLTFRPFSWQISVQSTSWVTLRFIYTLLNSRCAIVSSECNYLLWWISEAHVSNWIWCVWAAVAFSLISRYSLRQDRSKPQHVKHYSDNIKTSSLQVKSDLLKAATREIRLWHCSDCKTDNQNFWHARNPPDHSTASSFKSGVATSLQLHIKWQPAW